MSDGGVKHQAVAVHDGCRHPVVDGAGRGLPGEPAPVAIELQAVGKVLCLFTGPDEQNDGKELLVAFVLLLLLQDQHEVVTKTRLHHDPVHSTRQVDVCRQEDDVLPLYRQRTGLYSVPPPAEYEQQNTSQMLIYRNRKLDVTVVGEQMDGC